MTQQALFEDERILKLKVVESGFDVLNNEDFDDKKDIQGLAHSPNKETNSKIGVTKEEFEEQAKKCYGVSQVEWYEEKKLRTEVMDKEFILRDDLRKWVFEEDKEGRYRERIMKLIKEMGIENWFKKMGYPTNEDSVWKNRYIGSITTLGEECKGHQSNGTEGKFDFENQAYYLWENYLPENMWNDDELKEEYKEGTQEYAKRQAEERADKKKWAKKEKAKERSITDEYLKSQKEFADNPFKISKQGELFKNDTEIKTKEDVEKEEEQRKQEELCVVCGKEKRTWDINERDKCMNCLKEFFYNEFDKAGLDKTGFREGKEIYTFYSHTTKLETLNTDLVEVAQGTMMSNEIFPYTIYIYDEFGTHTNTLGITKEFGEHLIKKYDLKKELYQSDMFVWRNKNIKSDEKGKELAELDKEIAEKRIEMNNLLIKKVKILKEKKNGAI